MDTKSKNIKYSGGAKLVAAIIFWLCFVGTFGSALFLLANYQIVESNNYFDTYQFKNDFARLMHNSVELNVKLKNEENIKATAKNDEEILEKMDRLRRIQDNLSGTVNFAYFIKNTQTGEEFTNVKGAPGGAAGLIKSQSTAVHINRFNMDMSYTYLYEDIRKLLSDTPYDVYAAAIEPLKPGDNFYEDAFTYSKFKSMARQAVYILIASLILMSIAFIYLVYVTGRRENGGKIEPSFVDRLYPDVFSAMVFFVALISMVSVLRIYNYVFDNLSNQVESLTVVAIVLSMDAVIGLIYCLSMVRQIKSGQIIKNTLTFKLFTVTRALIKLGFSGKLFKAWTLGLLLAYGGANGILFFFMAIAKDDGFVALITALILIAINIAAVYFGAKVLLSLTQIMGAAKEISKGNLDYALDNTKLSIAFLDFARDIQSIQGGLKKAVAEAVKGERMKTDLITNVSHDLKTPLTSIINFVDLLKKENLSNEKAEVYVGILEEKSAKLRQLVEDLVEASKASSGNLAVKAEKVDLHELVLQACGEYEEKIKNAELDVRIVATDKKILVYADGKHMWRIVENLLSNVMKYSMPNSRVYINIVEGHEYGSLTIKNISAFPLDISPEQLTERFVRGDVSRTTEGSGLGLSIAQSLAVMQGGNFRIEIDGDLFKVTVEMPLYSEE